MNFRIISEITDIETIARGRGVHARQALNRQYGYGKWCKMKGKAYIELANGDIRYAELHWYEAHGIGRRRIKRKRFLDE
ncbi:hypothetical protein H8E77_33955 [bacterium]|nr:hypothetical protein [bacterium]